MGLIIIAGGGGELMRGTSSTVILEFDLQLIATKLVSTASYTEKCAL